MMFSVNENRITVRRKTAEVLIIKSDPEAPEIGGSLKTAAGS